MLNEEVTRYEKLTGTIADNIPISRIGGFLDGYDKAIKDGGTSAIELLKICRYCWADQIPNEGQKISDYDAITQAIKCLEEYNESDLRVRKASYCGSDK